jgi:hypothetical protein
LINWSHRLNRACFSACDSICERALCSSRARIVQQTNVFLE